MLPCIALSLLGQQRHLIFTLPNTKPQYAYGHVRGSKGVSRCCGYGGYGSRHALTLRADQRSLGGQLVVSLSQPTTAGRLWVLSCGYTRSQCPRSTMCKSGASTPSYSWLSLRIPQMCLYAEPDRHACFDLLCRYHKDAGMPPLCYGQLPPRSCFRRVQGTQLSTSISGGRHCWILKVLRLR